MAPPKVKEIKLKAGGGGSSRSNPLMALMALQARGQAGQNPNEVVTGRTDPFTGEKTETPESVEFRRYTVDEIRNLGMSESFKAHSDYINNLIDNDPDTFSKAFAKATVNVPLLTTGQSKGNILGFPTTMGDEVAINLNRSLADMSDRLVRLRSGAQINHQEYDRLTSLLPSFKDLTVPIDETGTVKFPTIKKALQDFNTELGRVKQRALFGGYYKPEEWEEVEQTGSGLGVGSIIPGQQAVGPQGGFDDERKKAILAIQKGAPESKVRDLFRSRTGQEL